MNRIYDAGEIAGFFIAWPGASVPSVRSKAYGICSAVSAQGMGTTHPKRDEPSSVFTRQLHRLPGHATALGTADISKWRGCATTSARPRRTRVPASYASSADWQVSADGRFTDFRPDVFTARFGPVSALGGER